MITANDLKRMREKARLGIPDYDPPNDPGSYSPTHDIRKDQDRDFVNDDNDMLIVIVGFGACIVVSLVFGVVIGALLF